MIWGWLISSAFITTIGLAMADLASSMPTSGGAHLSTP
jgi:amino acid transporter